jgi:Ser/Thr protein kinase RdoA (MazF antagonist)
VDDQAAQPMAAARCGRHAAPQTTDGREGEHMLDRGDDQTIVDVLRAWSGTAGDANSWEPLHHKGTVLAVTAAGGGRFVLKAIVKEVGTSPRAERLASEYRVLRHLHEEGVPVALPILTDDHRLFVQRGDQIYTLSPLLPTGGAPEESAAWEPGRVNTNLGAAIGRLHRALATYPSEIPSWRMDLPHRILDQAVSRIIANLHDERAVKIEAVLLALAGEFTGALTALSEQPIHGDCHGGNIVLCAGEVSGFVDLDHLPTGPKIYDLGSLLADQVKWRIDRPERLGEWLATAGYVISGYEQENTLSGREKEAIW